jgi:hypothetical protein
MRAMRLPERFAPHEAVQERDRGIGKIVERKNDGCRSVALDRELHQQPAQQEPDRKASRIAEKKAGDRLVEGGKAEHRAK